MGISQQIGASSLIKPGVIDNSAERPASPYEGQVIYERDTDEVFVYNGGTWEFPNAKKVAIFQDQRTSGSTPGSVTTGLFVKRALNTTVANNISGCSLASSVVTLPAGTYLVRANATFYRVNLFQLRLQNTTAGTTLQTGINGYADIDDPDGEVCNGLLDGYITLTGSTNIELQYRASNNLNTNSQGVATSWGTEVYATLAVEKVS